MLRCQGRRTAKWDLGRTAESHGPDSSGLGKFVAHVEKPNCLARRVGKSKGDQIGRPAFTLPPGKQSFRLLVGPGDFVGRLHQGIISACKFLFNLNRLQKDCGAQGQGLRNVSSGEYGIEAVQQSPDEIHHCSGIPAEFHLFEQPKVLFGRYNPDGLAGGVSRLPGILDIRSVFRSAARNLEAHGRIQLIDPAEYRGRTTEEVPVRVIVPIPQRPSHIAAGHVLRDTGEGDVRKRV